MAHYVYRYFNADGRLLYVGCSKNPWKRYQTHRADSRLWINEVTRGRISVFATKEIALEAEKAAIIAEKPLYNRQHRWDNREGWSQQDYIDYALGLLHTSADPRWYWKQAHATEVQTTYAAMFGEKLPIKPKHMRAVA